MLSRVAGWPAGKYFKNPLLFVQRTCILLRCGIDLSYVPFLGVSSLDLGPPWRHERPPFGRGWRCPRAVRGRFQKNCRSVQKRTCFLCGAHTYCCGAALICRACPSWAFPPLTWGRSGDTSGPLSFRAGVKMRLIEYFQRLSGCDKRYSRIALNRLISGQLVDI